MAPIKRSHFFSAIDVASRWQKSLKIQFFFIFSIYSKIKSRNLFTTSCTVFFQKIHKNQVLFKQFDRKVAVNLHSPNFRDNWKEKETGEKECMLRKKNCLTLIYIHIHSCSRFRWPRGRCSLVRMVAEIHFVERKAERSYERMGIYGQRCVHACTFVCTVQFLCCMHSPLAAARVCYPSLRQTANETTTPLRDRLRKFFDSKKVVAQM